MNRKTSIAAVSALASIAAFATDATLKNPDAKQAYWLTLGNWVDSHTGEALAALPTNATDNVTFSTPGKNVYAQRIGTSTGQDTTEHASFTVNSVTGDIRHVICNTFVWREGEPTKYPTLTVLDPNGFLGWWFTGDAHANFRFPASASFTPEITAISANARPEVTIPDAGTEAHLGALYNGGAMTKLGGGELVVDGAGGANTRIYVAEGGVTLSHDSASLEDLLSGAAVHFDASDATTRLEYVSQEDGRTYVTNWADVRGNGVVAKKPNAIYTSTSRTILMNPPFVAAGAADSGLDMLDFGSATTDAESVTAFGPTNCLMGFEKISNAREAFYVAKYHAKPGFNPVLGDNAEATLQPANTLLGGSANYGARTGAVFANCTKVVANEFWPESGHGLTNLWVMSFSSPSNMVLSRVASDQDYVGRVGGVMVGEILIYTNELTNAERVRINSYLYGKWKTGDGIDVDAGQLFAQGASATVGVADGGTASVLDLVASGTTVVKTGGGTLEVDTLHPSDATLDVRAGTVKFSKAMVAPSTSAPARNPAVWLDASDDTSYETIEIEGYATPFVTSWTDRRGGPNAVSATGSTLAAPRKPTIATGASSTGLDVMDLKTTGNSFFKFPWFGNLTPRFYGGFAVVRQLNTGLTYVPVFGSKNMTFMREGSAGGSHGRFISENYTHPVLGAALWTLDGMPQDPVVYNATLKDTSNFHVIAFSAREKVLVDGIAVARDNDNTYSGGMQVGELILYDRELSDKERRDTEAYLMAKWNGAVHPSAGSSAHRYEFASGVDQVIDTEGDASVTSVSGGTGALVKRGGGSAVIATAVTSGVSSVSVEAGSLTLSAGNPGVDWSSAIFHFDAMDENSLTYTVDAGGRTNVTQWADTRGNGLVAEAVIKATVASGVTTTNPALRAVATRTGVTRPMIDFGTIYGTGSANGCACMQMNQDFTNVREAHVVYLQRSPNGSYMTWGTSSSYLDFYRANDGKVLGSSAHARTKNGYIAVDGNACAWDADYPTPSIPHLLSFAPTEGAHINSIALDRINTVGGCEIGEQIAFSSPLSAAHRKYVQEYLMWKWFDVGIRPVWTNAAYSAISVAAGSSLTFADAPSLFVPSLSGAGSVTADEVFGVSSLSISAVDALAGNALHVDGAVAFADNVAVTVSDMPFRPTAGDYVIFSANSLANVDVSGWTLYHDTVSGSRSCSLAKSGNSVVLRVANTGLMLIVH